MRCLFDNKCKGKFDIDSGSTWYNLDCHWLQKDQIVAYIIFSQNSYNSFSPVLFNLLVIVYFLLTQWLILFVAGWRKNGDGRGVSNGRHWAFLRGTFGGNETSLDRLRGSNLLLEIKRIPTQRFRQIVSHHFSAKFCQSGYSLGILGTKFSYGDLDFCI